jgi:hypothetical protein
LGERARDPEIDCLIQIQLAFIYLFIISFKFICLYFASEIQPAPERGSILCSLTWIWYWARGPILFWIQKAQVSFSPVMTHAHSFVCTLLGLDQKWSPHAIQISKHLSLENGTSWTCEKHVLVRVFFFNIKIKNIDFNNLKRWWESYSIIYVHQNL